MSFDLNASYDWSLLDILKSTSHLTHKTEEMLTAYFEFTKKIREVKTCFRIFENNDKIFILVSQEDPKTNVYSLHLMKKLKKYKSSKKRIVYCILKNHEDLDTISEITLSALDGKLVTS